MVTDLQDGRKKTDRLLPGRSEWHLFSFGVNYYFYKEMTSTGGNKNLIRRRTIKVTINFNNYHQVLSIIGYRSYTCIR